MSGHRPSPEELLAAVQADEAAKGRGRLRIFLGMCPGVGKTYAMLEAARRELNHGRAIVIGFVETHGRPETETLLEGLPALPRLKIPHQGITLTELDLDAVLARRPQLVVVDELAHTNAPGARHPKRWQDIEELRDAGIDVFTTLNVQHVESRAGTVRQITGAPVQETVPDSVLDRADIELVDLTPDELLERLRSGRVYVPERAVTAAANFFRVGNLIALRELALRLAAEHAGQDVRDFLRSHQSSGPWKTGARLLVAIGPSPLSASLVRWTRRLADGLQAPWLAVYVESSRPLTSAEQVQLAENLAVARQLGAEVITTSDQDVVRGLLRAARDHNVTQIVFGKPGSDGWTGFWRWRTGLRRLIEASGDIDVLVVRADKGELSVPLMNPLRPLELQGRQYVAAAGITAGVTLLAWVVQRWIGYQAVALIYLSAVVLLALFVGRGPVFLAASCTALCWNFLFVPPTFTFRISGFHDSMMLAMYFLVALATGQLTARLRLQESAERLREERTAALYRLMRELTGATTFPEVLSAAIREVRLAFGADVALMLPDEGGKPPLVRYPSGGWTPSDKEEGVADWAFRHDHPAGRFTDTLPQAAGLHLPLSAGGKPSGVIALRFSTGEPLTAPQRSLLESFVRQIALVVDRQRLRDAEANAKLLAQSEHLSRTLLNSVSHELRTPIAAITSATSALKDAGPLSASQVLLTGELELAALRLNRVVHNLLGAARLQSGHLHPNLDWCDVRELIAVAIRGLESQFKDRPVTVDVPKDLPLIRADFVLLEQALSNLLLNAATHTPVGSSIEVRVRTSGSEATISVIDAGAGIPEGQLARIFDLFYRGDAAGPGGTGLGLPIAKGFVEAQGGRISVRNDEERGAEFTIWMPIPNPPPVLETV